MSDQGHPPDYDAFGDERPTRPRTIKRQVLIAFSVVFWSLALLLVAGRVHYAPHATPAPIELAVR